LLSYFDTMKGKFVNRGSKGKPWKGKNSTKWAAILFFLAACFSFGHCEAQTKEDIKLVSNLIEAPQYANQYHAQKHEKNLATAVARWFFVIYKNYVSSQDGNHCTFSPSCSEYALQSVKKKGLFIGVLAAFDRLTRCNGLSPDKYPIRKGTNLLYDPVE